MPNLRQIDFAVNFLTSLCLGTAWISPVLSFFQIEWLPPSLAKEHPLAVRCASRAVRFMLESAQVAHL
jgi:hypothetical protein